ncbi:unnamed protein product [Protopolystoma xenopodis]|uniref:Uncharacterized protein n=1 Tax=Protopolystoma xenopodis TaxID=117903 RepID=A0A3S5B325_9PLAT|nr:unnamed protein product [Protopolystoma xenopodis]
MTTKGPPSLISRMNSTGLTASVVSGTRSSYNGLTTPEMDDKSFANTLQQRFKTSPTFSEGDWHEKSSAFEPASTGDTDNVFISTDDFCLRESTSGDPLQALSKSLSSVLARLPKSDLPLLSENKPTDKTARRLSGVYWQQQQPQKQLSQHKCNQFSGLKTSSTIPEAICAYSRGPRVVNSLPTSQTCKVKEYNKYFNI